MAWQPDRSGTAGPCRRRRRRRPGGCAGWGYRWASSPTSSTPSSSRVAVRLGYHKRARTGRHSVRWGTNGRSTRTPRTTQWLPQATRRRPAASGSWCHEAPNTLRPLRRMRVSSITTRSGASWSGSTVASRSTRPRPSWSADQRARAKNVCARSCDQTLPGAGVQQHPGDRARSGLGEEPAGQRGEGLEGRGGKAGREPGQQPGRRRRCGRRGHRRLVRYKIGWAVDALVSPPYQQAGPQQTTQPKTAEVVFT